MRVVISLQRWLKHKSSTSLTGAARPSARVQDGGWGVLLRDGGGALGAEMVL